MTTFEDFQARWMMIQSTQTEQLRLVSEKLPQLLSDSSSDFFTQGIELLFGLIEGLSFLFDMSDNQIVLSTNYSSDQEAIQRLVISEVILEESEWFNIYTTGIFDQMLWLVTLDVLNEVESSTYLTTVPHLVLTAYPDIRRAISIPEAIQGDINAEHSFLFPILLKDFRTEWGHICERVDNGLADGTIVFNLDNGLINLLGLIGVPMLAEHREIFRQVCIGNINGLLQHLSIVLAQGK